MNGAVDALFRYPFKSMEGEAVSRVLVTRSGLLGDRAYAFVDEETRMVASAKNPGKWRALLDCRARFVEEPTEDTPRPPVIVDLPGGVRLVSTDRDEANAGLSRHLGRRGSIRTSPPASPLLEMDWPDIDGLYRDKNSLTEEGIPEGAFFDVTPVHLLTTASLRELARHTPDSRLDLRRFRPNILVAGAGEGFVEAAWVGKHVAIGESLVLQVAMESPRCVMTTVPQGDLPRDLAVLRAVASGNRSHLGVYAVVTRPGVIAPGDPVHVFDGPNGTGH